MEDSLLARFAARLRQEEEDLTAQIESYESTFRAGLKDAVHELSSYDNHPADLGSETHERSKDLALLDNARELRRKVKAALRRIEEGTYGRCVSCGADIQLARLEALPYVELCLDCQREEEAHDPPRWRPLEEEALHPPFGRSFRDRASTVGYDGEDAWQDVARYGTSESPSDVGGAVSYDELYVDADERRGVVEEVEKLIRTTPEGEPY